MIIIIQALKESIEQENWGAALFNLATIPDICSKTQFSKLNTNVRYPNWINEYLHKVDISYKHHICGFDFYALRCTLLHEGHSNIEGQQAFRRIQHIKFIEKGSHLITLSNNYVGSELDGKHILVLSVKQLAVDILKAYELWFNTIKDNNIIIDKLSNGVKIEKKLNIGGISIT